MGEVKVQSHNVGLTSYQLTYFRSMSICPPIPEIQHFRKFDLENPGSRSNDHDDAQLQV